MRSKMTFGRFAKNREIAVILQILDCFGTVEERQMRKLFSYLPDSQYGPIMTRLYREGLVRRSEDGELISSSRRNLRKINVKESVMAFWVFIAVKDKIKDFFASEAPALCTISANSSDYDLIPVTEKTIPVINSEEDDIPDSVIRFFVVEDSGLIPQIEGRLKNDYVFIVSQEGITDTYEL